MLEQLWKQDSVNKNVQEIARLSGTMLDKFTNVTLDLENINKHLKAAGDAYLQVKSRLAEGKGNLVVTAQKIVRLGQLKFYVKLPEIMEFPPRILHEFES